MDGHTAIPLSINFEASPVLEREGGELEQCIDSILDLIVFTPRGSFSADPEFGFEYWNHEFSNINVREFNNSYLGIMDTGIKTTNEVSRRQCEESLRQSILAYEPRLLNPQVKIELDINERVRPSRQKSKYEMRILITGQIYDGLGVGRDFEKKIAFMVETTVKKSRI